MIYNFVLIFDVDWFEEIVNMLLGFVGSMNVYCIMVYYFVLLQVWFVLCEYVVNQMLLGVLCSEVVILCIGMWLDLSYEWQQYIICVCKVGLFDKWIL